MDFNVTQLTYNGINVLFNEGRKNFVVAQCIEPELIPSKGNSSSMKYKTLLSDGSVKQKAVLGNQAAETINERGIPKYAVCKVVDFMIPAPQNDPNSTRKLIIITQIDVIYDNIREIIGNPIDYSTYVQNNNQNPLGSNQIPSKYLPNNTAPQRQQQLNNNPNLPYQPRSAINQSHSLITSVNQIPQQQNNVGHNQNQQIQHSNSFPIQRQNSMGTGQQNNNNNNMYGNNQLNNNFNENSNPNRQPRQSGAISVLPGNKLQPTEDEYLPFKQLAPYQPFIIKARVIHKSDIRTFQKGNGESCVFSIILVDKDGDDIEATFFGDAARQFHGAIDENKVYVLTNGSVKAASTKYNKTKSDYQIVFDNVSAQIQPMEDDGGIKMSKLSYTKIDELSNVQNGQTADVVAYVMNPGSIDMVPLRTGQQKERRNVQLYDDSNVGIELTLWGDSAIGFSSNKDDMIICKGVRVTEFQGKKGISNGFNTKLIQDPNLFPDDERIQELSVWKASKFEEGNIVYSQGGGYSGGGNFGKHGLYTLYEINSMTENMTSEKLFFDTRAHIAHIKSDTTAIYYAACGQCGRKSYEESIGQWRCNNCSIMFNQPVYKYNMNVKFSDQSGHLWMKAFDKIAQEIVQKDANHIKSLRDQGDEASVTEIFKECHYNEYNLRIVVKMDGFQGNQRPSATILKCTPIDYLQNSQDVLQQLIEYQQR